MTGSRAYILSREVLRLASPGDPRTVHVPGFGGGVVLQDIPDRPLLPREARQLAYWLCAAADEEERP